jgi:hypothetical protein
MALELLALRLIPHGLMFWNMKCLALTNA